jgi:hypothetical protein
LNQLIDQQVGEGMQQDKPRRDYPCFLMATTRQGFQVVPHQRKTAVQGDPAVIDPLLQTAFRKL